MIKHIRPYVSAGLQSKIGRMKQAYLTLENIREKANGMLEKVGDPAAIQLKRCGISPVVLECDAIGGLLGTR